MAPVVSVSPDAAFAARRAASTPAPVCALPQPGEPPLARRADTPPDSAAYPDPAANPDSAALLPAERIAVDFSGAGSGVAELTWGQREIWSAMVRQGWLRLGGVMPLPAGRTTDDVVAELRFMMSRFPSLRTRLRFDAAGRPTQELFASGQVVLEVYDTAAEPSFGGDPARLAAAVEQQYLAKERDFADDWPIRIAVVRRAGVPIHLVVISCHLVADGAGMVVLSREVEQRSTEPVRGAEQLDLAQWQRSPAAARHTAAAMRHVEALLGSVPPRPLPRSADPREPRHWTGRLTSAALRAAVRAIGERTQADSSTILLALFAIALGRRGLLNPAVVRPLAGNRFRPGLGELVGNLVQSGVCVLDPAGATVDEVVAAAQRAVRTAYKHAYFDPEAEVALFERLAAVQGAAWGVHAWAFFNDRRAGLGPVPPDEPAGSAPEHISELLPRTAFQWVEGKDNPYEPLFLHIEEVPEGLVLIVSADTWHVAPADNEGLARDMEALAVAAAADPAVSTGVAKRG